MKLCGKAAWRLAQLVAAFLSITAASAADSTSQPGLFARAGSLTRDTHLIELQQGSRLSNLVESAQNGGFESAHGNWVTFDRWYRSNWTDARATFMTQLTPNWGVLWGPGTGERGQKYAIDPSLKLGLVFQRALQKNASVSLKGTTIVGGRLREKSCVADYGEVGGVQEVNCRLAATPLEPSETLRYNLNEKPHRHSLLVQYTRLF